MINTIEITPEQKLLSIVHIPVKDIYEDEEMNCRQHIAGYEVVELADSIKKTGLLQAIVVQPWINNPPFKYRIVVGHRRFKAHQVLKYETIACTVREGLTDLQVRILNLKENIERKDLNILQESLTLQKFRQAGYTLEEVSKMVGMSKGWVQVRFNLLDLPNEIQEAAASNFLNQEQIKDLYSLPSKELQFAAVKQIKESKLRGEKKSIKIKEKKTNPLAKKLRNKDEIFKMQDFIIENIGANFGTRTLAWAAGEISDIELYRDIKELAEEKGLSFSIPNSNLVPV